MSAAGPRRRPIAIQDELAQATLGNGSREAGSDGIRLGRAKPVARNAVASFSRSITVLRIHC